MEPLITAIIDKGLPFGMLLAAILYFRQLNDKKDIVIAGLYKEKDDLQKELRDIIERFSDKSHEAINNNTIALTAFKELLKHG